MASCREIKPNFYLLCLVYSSCCLILQSLCLRQPWRIKLEQLRWMKQHLVPNSGPDLYFFSKILANCHFRFCIFLLWLFRLLRIKQHSRKKLPSSSSLYFRGFPKGSFITHHSFVLCVFFLPRLLWWRRLGFWNECWRTEVCNREGKKSRLRLSVSSLFRLQISLEALEGESRWGNRFWSKILGCVMRYERFR